MLLYRLMSICMQPQYDLEYLHNRNGLFQYYFHRHFEKLYSISVLISTIYYRDERVQYYLKPEHSFYHFFHFKLIHIFFGLHLDILALYHYPLYRYKLSRYFLMF